MGVERYDWGSALDLPGAADHATRFARWAVDRGVPPGRIRLARSWVTAPPAPLPSDVTSVDPTTDALDETLHMLMHEGGDLLLLYWCGHGVTQAGVERRLLTANATEHSIRNLALTEIQKLLTSTEGRGFNHVLVVVDACATFLERLNAKRILPTNTFGELIARDIPFSLYLSTDLGQIAEFDPTRGATFSTHVLHWLEQDPGRTFPPDLESLSRDVRTAFMERAERGDFRQRPVLLVVKTPGVREMHETYVSSGAAGLQHSQLHRLADAVVASGLLGGERLTENLVALLGDSGAIETRVARAFADGRGDALVDALADAVVDETCALELASVRAVWERQRRTAPLLQAFPRITRDQVLTALHRALPPGAVCRARDLGDAVECVAELAPPIEHQTYPLHRLVVMLEHLTGTRVADDWFMIDAQHLAWLRDAASGWLARTPAHVVIDLRSGGPPTGGATLPFEVTAHVRRKIGDQLRWERHEAISGRGPDGAPTLAGVQAAVQELLDHVYDMGEVSFTVGLIVPRVLQDERPEAWPLLQDHAPSRALGVEHPVVLHSGERLTARPRTRAAWRRRAADVAAAVTAAEPTIKWVTDAERRQAQGVRQAAESSTAAVIGLEFLPGPAGDDLSSDAIVATVMAGAPYVVWSEGEPEDWASFCRQVGDLVVKGPFTEVLHRLHEVRRREPSSVEVGVRLLWDDPDLLAPVLPLLGAATLEHTRGSENG